MTIEQLINPESRYRLALEKASELVQLVRTLTKAFPEHEDMVMMPEMRVSVMDLHKSVMMFGAANNKEDYHAYLSDVHGVSTRLQTQFDIALRLHYVTDEEYEKVVTLLDAIHEYTSMPWRGNLALVK